MQKGNSHPVMIVSLSHCSHTFSLPGGCKDTYKRGKDMYQKPQPIHLLYCRVRLSITWKESCKHTLIQKGKSQPGMKMKNCADYHRLRSLLRLPLFIILFLLVVLSFSGPVEGYKNYTVGDSLGWYDSLEKSGVDYQRWAASKNFTLGDFLIFNTDNNHSVIQTYNFTTYHLCDYEDSSDNDTFQWSSADPSSTTPHPVTVSVPLVKLGMTYFFSSDYDGEQCQNGQHFKINVTYGRGLPPSLRSPAEDSPAPVSPQSGDDESAPDTLVPSNFDNPKDVNDDGDQPSKSVSVSEFSKLFGVRLHGLVLLVGFLCHIS